MYYLSISTVDVPVNVGAEILAHVCECVAFSVRLVSINLQTVFTTSWQLYCNVYLKVENKG